MGKNAQRKKERHAQKRREKRKRQEQAKARDRGTDKSLGFISGLEARHRARLARQIPQAWPGERLEDAATFDDAALASLPQDMAHEVLAVREAIQLATEFRGEDAIKSASIISRSSPLSEWRIFIRGLVDWLAKNLESAGKSWERLDPDRRPARIAKTMMLAARGELENASPEPSTMESKDHLLEYHAKLLRREFLDRPAIRVAKAGLSMPEESKELLLGPRKLHWLKEFVKEFNETEPQLTAALCNAALNRAFAQEYADVFEEAAKSLPGPLHDPRNHLLAFHYYNTFEESPDGEKRAEQALDNYLTRDLPANEALPASLRGAIASHLHLLHALALIRSVAGGGLFGFLFAPPDHGREIRKEFRAALDAASRNLLVYKSYVEWIESKLDQTRLSKKDRQDFEKELASVMRRWAKSRPEDVEPRLWLVDFLLENELLDEAKPHVEFLAASRHENPLVRATPWKWQLLEAMRLCRRKAWLAEVPSRLDQAESQWPAWLPKRWLVYLRAAWILRTGNIAAFEEQHQMIRQEFGLTEKSLVDACMMLGAAQQMRIPAEGLKPLRAPVERALEHLDELPTEELIEVGGFFWDLHRVKLVYPAYRNHGGKFGKALVDRWEQSSQFVVERMHDERVQKAVLWGSEHRFWSSNYGTKYPLFFKSPAIESEPIFVAARLNAVLKESVRWNLGPCRDLGPKLQQAATTVRDPYYRYWFESLASELEEALATSFDFSRFSEFVGELDDDEDDDEMDVEFMDDDLDSDEQCDCPKCRAARRRANRESK